MKLVGLTGNTGCGKTAVAQILAEFPDVIIFDGDARPLDQISQDASEMPDHTLVIVQSSVIFEMDWEDQFAAIIVAICGPQEQLRRIGRNRDMSISQERKAARAHFIVDTDCSLSELGIRTYKMYRKLRQYMQRP